MFQKYVSKNYVLDLVELAQNLVLYFQSTTIPVDYYKRKFKACLEVCKAEEMISGAKEAAANIVVEEENIEASSLAGNKLK